MEIIIILALICIGIGFKVDELKNWDVIFECNATKRGQAEKRFAYLKSNGVRCRIKTPFLKSLSQDAPMQSTVKLLVAKKHEAKAYKLLVDYF